MAKEKDTKNNKNTSDNSNVNNKKQNINDKNQANNSKRRYETKKEPIIDPVPDVNPSDRFIHQFIPYIIVIFTVLLIACYLCVQVFDAEKYVGVVGKWINDILFGLFGWCAFFIPIVFINLAVFWRKYVDMHILPLKTVFSFLIMTVLSSLVHNIARGENTERNFAIDIKQLWTDGKLLSGGGVVGGTVGEVFHFALGVVGSMIVLIAGAAVLIMFLFGTTPRDVWIYIRYRIKLAREKAEKKREEKLAAKEEAERLTEEEKKKNELAELRRNTLDGEKNEADDKEKTAKLVAVDTASGEVVGEIKDGDIKKSEEPCEPVISTQIESAYDEKLKADSDLLDIKDMIRTRCTPAAKENERDKTDDAGIACHAEKENGIKNEPSANVINETESDLNDKNGANSVIKTEGPVRTAQKTEKITENDFAAEAADEGNDAVSQMSLIVDNEDMSKYMQDDDPDAENAPMYTDFAFPPIELLAENTNPKITDFAAELGENAEKLSSTLKSFHVNIKNISYSRGPTITRYELEPEAGVRVRSIANLVDDIALSLATTGVRIEAPIPGKSAVGVEVPNKNKETVFLRDLIDSKTFDESTSKLTVCLGADVAGKPIFFNIDKMPHMLIAGATGMGKSVCINSLIVSLLYKARPEDVRLVLIDPKKVEFALYRDMPHLYVRVVSDPKKATGILSEMVREMENRFELIESVNVRDITSYNKLAEKDPDLDVLPRIVIIIDELADLMMTATNDVENYICRLAQKARAAGIHLIIGTQRPSVDVITGLIKANIPSRIAFTVSSQIDSRTIIDIGGAEKLIGRGDMLFAPVGASKPIRVQGAFVGETEVERIVEYLKEHNPKVRYKEEVEKCSEDFAKAMDTKKGSTGLPGDIPADGCDPKLRDALEFAISIKKISTSALQRKFSVGYSRAAKMIDQLEERGFVSGSDGNKPRDVKITIEEFRELVVNGKI